MKHLINFQSLEARPPQCGGFQLLFSRVLLRPLHPALHSFSDSGTNSVPLVLDKLDNNLAFFLLLEQISPPCMTE